MQTTESKCGTYAGYNVHTKFKTEVCGPCRQAATDYNRERRRKTGQTKRMLADLPTKRFTEAEMAAEHYRAKWTLAQYKCDCTCCVPAKWRARVETVERFATTPSYDEVDS